jgi:alpha-galactosidase
VCSVPDPVCITGLDPDRSYRVERIELPGEHLGPQQRRPQWFDAGFVATGRTLAAVGLQPPVMDPETALLLRLVQVD